nr:ATP-dependent DNA helicase Q-like SIM isoform X2 [Solanum lycopersicum]
MYFELFNFFCETVLYANLSKDTYASTKSKKYGMYTSCYRAKLLVEYFDEHLLLKIYLVDVKTHWLLCFFLCSLHVKDVCLCFSVDFLPRFFSGCDICIKGPPERQNLEAEAMIILQVVATHCRNFADISYGGYEGRLGESPNIKALVGKIREQIFHALPIEFPGDISCL